MFAAVDQGLSDRIAAAIGHGSVSPLKSKSAAEAEGFRPDIGYVTLYMSKKGREANDAP